MLEEEYQPRRVVPRHLRATEPEPEFGFQIRVAQPTDLPHVREIYNHYVKNSTVTFDEQPMSLAAARKKFATIAKLELPFLIAESPRGVVLGYAYVFPWRDKAAFRYTVESSIYLGPAATGRGIGTALLTALLEECRERGIREVVAVIADRGAEASLKLHENFGFERIGHMGKVGFKFDRWLGTILLQKSLKKRR